MIEASWVIVGRAADEIKTQYPRRESKSLCLP